MKFFRQESLDIVDQSLHIVPSEPIKLLMNGGISNIQPNLRRYREVSPGAMGVESIGSCQESSISPWSCAGWLGQNASIFDKTLIFPLGNLTMAQSQLLFPSDDEPEIKTEKSPSRPTLYILDAYSLIYQVYHAIDEMTGPAGQPTNAVFGIVRDLFNIARDRALVMDT